MVRMVRPSSADPDFSRTKNSSRSHPKSPNHPTLLQVGLGKAGALRGLAIFLPVSRTSDYACGPQNRA
jgi:hypothetical protein